MSIIGRLAIWIGVGAAVFGALRGLQGRWHDLISAAIVLAVCTIIVVAIGRK
jgi:hypothetical protein